MDYYGNDNSNNPIYNYGSNNESIYARDENSILSKVFGWMTAGLGISAIAALGSYQIFGLYMLNPLVFYGLIIAELVLVIVFSARITKLSSTAAKLCFIAYSVINGLTLSNIFFVYELGSIYVTFFVAASMFGVAAIYGKVTKSNLSGVGTYLIMGLWGLIIGGLVNLFLRNEMLDYIISGVGILIFVGLTAYDVNRIKEIAIQEGNEESTNKLAIWGALQLYLDFINLFLKLLRFFGKRKN